MTKKEKEFWEKSTEAYLKGRYCPNSLQRAMNEEAIELIQGNSYIQEFADDIKKVRERLQKPRANEKSATVLEDAKRLRRDRTEYVGKFKEDVEKIRKRIYEE